MKTSRLIVAAALVAGSLGWWGSIAVADQVILKNGNVIEGQIESEDSRFVVIRTITNQVRIPRDRVAEVVRSAPGEIELMRAQEALRANNLDEARRLAQEALNKGAAAEPVEEVIASVEAREAERELLRYRDLIAQARASAARGEESAALREIRELMNNYAEDSPVRAEMVGVLVEYHLRVAAILKDRVRDDEAISQFQRVLELDPTRARAYLEVADIYRRRNSAAAWPLAIQAYRRALEVGEDTLDQRSITRVYWEMGDIFRQQVNWREASIFLRRVYERDPNFNYQLVDRLHQSLSSFARELRDAGNHNAALAVVDEAINIRRDVINHVLKGEILNAMERYEDSIAAYRQALEIGPRTRNVNYMIAVNHLAMGELFERRDALEREIEVFPENYEALCELGEDALDLGDLERAQTFFTRARSVERARPRATLGLAKAARFDGRLLEARNLVQEVLGYQENNREANLEMGRILLEDGKETEARDYFTKVLSLIDEASPAEQETLKELKADALIARGEIGLMTAGPGTANNDFRSALQVLPDYGQAYFSIGNAFRRKYNSTKRMNDLREAETNMLRARELAPENARFALELGILYAEILAKEDVENERQHLENARRQWRDYIELGGSNVAQVEAWIASLGS